MVSPLPGVVEEEGEPTQEVSKQPETKEADSDEAELSADEEHELTCRPVLAQLVEEVGRHQQEPSPREVLAHEHLDDAVPLEDVQGRLPDSEQPACVTDELVEMPVL